MSSNGQNTSENPVKSEPMEGTEGGQNEAAKTSEYVKELLKEKIELDASTCPNAMRLIDEEVAKAQARGKNAKGESRYVDIYKEKPVRVAVKVLVPVKEHPRFNFVGKLLGPKGNSLKRLQEETLTRMAILGRGSMRDKAKEEECRNTLDPKYSHLSEDLHVEIVALAPAAEAHARLAFALAEIRKYLVPDSSDEIRMEQLREIQASTGRGRGGRGGRGGGMSRAGGMGGGPLLPRPMPGKSKVLSILERARVAMEESYQDYEEPSYYDAPAPGPGFGGDYNGGAGDYYDTGYPEPSAGRWKGYKSTGGGASRYGARSAPYARPGK